MNDADKFANISRKKKFTKVAIHGRYNRCAEEIAALEDRDWAQIGSRTRLNAIGAGGSNAGGSNAGGSDTHPVIKEEPVEADTQPANAPAPYQPLGWTDPNVALLREAIGFHRAHLPVFVANHMSDRLGRLVDVDDIRCRLDPRLNLRPDEDEG